MKRYAKNKNLLTPPPVEQIDVPQKHVKLRVLLFVTFIILAVVCFAIVMVSLLKVEAGWFAVPVDSSSVQNCGGDFVFTYYFEKNQDKQYRQQVGAKYTEASENAYALFNCDKEIEGVKNVWYINNHPNEDVQISASLYNALKLFDNADNRFLYYAPVYAVYNQLFESVSDDDASLCDPAANAETKAYCDAMIAIVSNQSNVHIDFLENSTIRLVVSDEYIDAFGDKTPIYIDFFWMKNAFIVDYLANVMISSGYDRGIISSYDGYTRNLADSQETFTANIFDKPSDEAIVAGRMAYNKKMSVVMLKDFPLSSDEDGYYTYEDGTVRSHFIDFSTGENASANSTFTAYSKTKTCAQIAIELSKIYLKDSLDDVQIASARENDIYSIYCKDSKIFYNDSDIEIKPIDYGEKSYIVEIIG